MFVLWRRTDAGERQRAGSSSLRFGRVALRLLAATLLAVGIGLVGTAAPASAAVSCYGDYCSGKDPQQTGCAADSYTTAYKDLAGKRLELRWSPTCRTNWARLVVYPTGVGCVTGGDLVAKQDTGYKQSSWLGVYICYISTATTYWTPQIYSPVRLVRAELANEYTAWS